MLHPVGPLPASVYWRRRALAFAGVVALLLLFWAVLPGGSGDDRPRDSAAAAGSPSPTEPAAAPTSVDPSGLTASAAPGGGPGPTGDGGPAVPATSTAAPTPTPRPSSQPVAPKACADSALRLTVSPARPAYVVGQAPVLRLQVRNVGTLSCIRDLGAALQEVLLYRGSQRLWSSNDCYPEGERDVEVLRPGVVRTFSVTWSGLSSRPKCAGVRTRVGAGSYLLLGRLGTLISPRAPMTLRSA